MIKNFLNKIRVKKVTQKFEVPASLEREFKEWVLTCKGVFKPNEYSLLLESFKSHLLLIGLTGLTTPPLKSPSIALSQLYRIFKKRPGAYFTLSKALYGKTLEIPEVARTKSDLDELAYLANKHLGGARTAALFGLDARFKLSESNIPNLDEKSIDDSEHLQ